MKLTDSICINLNNVTSVRCYEETMYIDFLGGEQPLKISNSNLDGVTVRKIYGRILERCE